ncbi:Oxygen-independent coproporphyrinogen-III oxidase [Weeksella virosa]|nr:Oxygen-independent coproporphyrinogen-III oxidase [Weeksella virosa]
MIDAIIQEVELRKKTIQSPIETIYFGGGTPSILDNALLSKLFTYLEKKIDLSSLQEVTLEANPDDLTREKLRYLRSTPINRLSIGVQSFFDNDLTFMHRAHKADEAENSIKMAQDFGFDNLTIDLIYGTPTTTDQQWTKNLNKAVDLQIPHISSYALTVEEKTILNHAIKSGKASDIDEEQQYRQFCILQEFLTQRNYIQYEISNFGKEGFFAKHNTSYWQYKPYYGFGPSAHSYNGRCRQWNIANNQLYIKTIAQGKLPCETENLSEIDRYNEKLMIGLRTMWGIEIREIKNLFARDIFHSFQKETSLLLAEGLLKEEEGFLRIPDENKFYTDGITSRLFYV